MYCMFSLMVFVIDNKKNYLIYLYMDWIPGTRIGCNCLL